MKKQIVYAVVDTETTGLRAGRDRITEAGIVFIKNGEIAGTWSRMVNPGVKIPEKISLLTGIHDKDVASAEEFFTLAEELDELTCDTVLVGHHVAFDYSFLKFEMGLAGMPFSRKTICTSELARFLFPDLRSYSLRYLCRYFGIINEQPHRAMADAMATAQLFLKLMQSEKVPDLEKIISGKRTMQFLPAHIRETILHRVPATPGIYYFFDRRGKPLYIGKASNLRSRVLSHFRGDGNSLKILAMAAKIHRIATEETGSALVAALMEDHEIRHYWPPWNEAQKRPNLKYGVVAYRDMGGRMRMAITQGVKSARHLRLFHQYYQAAEYIRILVKKHALEGTWCGVPDITGVDPEKHDEHFHNMLHDLAESGRVEIFFTTGRVPGEKGFVLVENGRYRGVGYFDEKNNPSKEFLESTLIPKYSSVTTETIISELRSIGEPDLVFSMEENFKQVLINE